MLYENTYGNIIEAPVTQHSFDDTRTSVTLPTLHINHAFNYSHYTNTHTHYLKLSRTPSLHSHLYCPSSWYHPPNNTWEMISVCENECFFYIKSLKHVCKLSRIHLSPWISEKQHNSNQHQHTKWPLPALLHWSWISQCGCLNKQ